MIKFIFSVIISFYNFVLFILLFYYLSRWRAIWFYNYGHFSDKITPFIIPCLLGVSSLLFFICKKKYINNILSIISLLFLQYYFFLKKYVFIEVCSCSWLIPFLDNDFHFWINLGIIIMCLFILFKGAMEYWQHSVINKI
jgi:hypothetical protein